MQFVNIKNNYLHNCCIYISYFTVNGYLECNPFKKKTHFRMPQFLIFLTYYSSLKYVINDRRVNHTRPTLHHSSDTNWKSIDSNRYYRKIQHSPHYSRGMCLPFGNVDSSNCPSSSSDRASPPHKCCY